jgi:PAS domain S-box-containing protein
LRAIFDSSPLGIAASDRHGFIVECNAAYQRMLGYSADELRRMHFLDLSDPDAGAENRQVFAELVAGARDQYVVEKTYKRKDGQTIWARVTATAIRDVRGELEFSVAMIEDITERHRMAQALVDSEKRHRSLLESLPLIVYQSDPNPPYAAHYVSPAVHLLGYSLEEWLRSSTSWVDSLHPADRDRVLAESEAAKRERRPFRCEYRVIARDGSERWFHDHGDFLYDDCGPLAWQGIMLDVTEQRQLEEQLRHSQKMDAVGKLAGGIAHDFNNLLTVIIGRAEFMRMASPGGVEWMQDLQEIREAAGRAASLTRQLLAYSRKQLLQPKVLRLDESIDAVAPLLCRLIGEDIELVQQHRPNVPSISADPGQLEQVVINLAVNARDAMPNGGVLTIATRATTIERGSEVSRTNDGISGRFSVLSVTDTGVGIDDATVSRIFEPFFTTKEVGHGTGLGLSTVYGIAKQSGGFVTVRTRLGMGTTFEIYLPALAEEVPEAPKLASALERCGGSETIMIVEDSDAVRTFAENVLRRLGYTVLSARDGEEALAMADRHSTAIDLVLTDVVMPRMGGRELAELITARRPGVRILFMSGYTDDVIIQKGLRDPSASFMEKPFTMASLAEHVRKRLDA